MRQMPLTAVLFLCVAACARDKAANTANQSGASAAGADRAAAAAAIANAVAAKPAAADSILKANGQTTESFQALMYDIASDSAMSVRYAAARKK